MQEVYGKRFAGSATEKITVAKELRDLSSKTKSFDEKFVLLRKATDLARTGGDAALMLQLVDAMSPDFEIDVPNVKRKLLSQFAADASDSVAYASLAQTSMKLIDELRHANRFDLALGVAHDWRVACERSGGSKYRDSAKKAEGFQQTLFDDWNAFQNGESTLKTTPDNAEANLAVGRWHYVNQTDWSSALPYLAKASDDELKAAAEDELAMSSPQAADWVKRGDQWWDLAQDRKGNEKKSLLLHAGQCYENALGGLEAGLVRVRIENRLAAIKSENVGDDAKLAIVVEKPKVEQKPPSKKMPETATVPKDKKSPSGQGSGGSRAVAKAGAAAPNTIVEGVGFGPFHVGASRNDLIKALGTPDAASDDRWLQWKSKQHVDCIVDNQRGAVELRFDPPFAFPLTTGIRIGSAESDVLKAYGTPDDVQEQNGGKRIRYHSRGVLFWFAGGRVSQIVVFQAVNPRK